MKWVLIILGLIVILVLVACGGCVLLGGMIAATSPSGGQTVTGTAAPGKAASTPVSKPPAKVGEVVRSNATALTVNAYQATATTAGALTKPKAGNRYAAVDVSIENVANQQVPYNPLYFKVRDSGGFEYNASLGGSPEPSLKSGDLQPGDRVRGWLAFEVPEGATGLQLLYTPIVIFDNTRIIVNLE